MPRFKDADWVVRECPIKPGAAADCREAQLAVLMDIRDELKALNRVIGCHNFIRLPGVFDQIAKNTKKPKRRKKALKLSA